MGRWRCQPLIVRVLLPLALQSADIFLWASSWSISCLVIVLLDVEHLGPLSRMPGVAGASENKEGRNDTAGRVISEQGGLDRVIGIVGMSDVGGLLRRTYRYVSLLGTPSRLTHHNGTLRP